MSSKTVVLGYTNKWQGISGLQGRLSENKHFDIKATFGGYTDSISPTLLPNHLGTVAVNCIGQGSHLEKMMGAGYYGKHDIDPQVLVGVRAGHFYGQDGDDIMFKICRKQNENRFYIMRNKSMNWLDVTPTQGIGVSNEYNYAVWRNKLFIVSGKEFKFGAKTGGVLVFNPREGEDMWETIETGQRVSNKYSSDGNDGGSPFFPITISFFEDRMYLGAGTQVKFSEHSNPNNVVGSLDKPFLGLLDTPPVLQDLLKPSTFILNQNGDEIRAMLNANGFLWIITNKRFYAYKALTVLNSELPAGLLWLDTLQEHKVSTGVYSQQAVMHSDEVFEFLTTKNKPSVGTLLPTISNEILDNQFGTRSGAIQETMRGVDWSRACMGSIGNGKAESINFISGSKCGSHNDITLMYKIYDDMTVFSKVPFIKASDWVMTDEGTFYLSSENGNLYKLNPDTNTVVDFLGGEETTESFPMVYQTGRIGVGKGDNIFSSKKVSYIYFVGASSEDTKLEFQLCNKDIDPETGKHDISCKEIKYKPNLNYQGFECDCNYEGVTPFVHNRGVIFHALIDVNSLNSISNVFDLRVVQKSAGYFAIHEVGLIYETIDNFHESILNNINI